MKLLVKHLKEEGKDIKGYFFRGIIEYLRDMNDDSILPDLWNMVDSFEGEDYIKDIFLLIPEISAKPLASYAKFIRVSYVLVL